jgi:hypothetical protein
MVDLTLCLITCGEDTEKECLQAIQHESANFAFEEVRNVRPQAAANNMVMDKVKTKYFIPLDSDIVLYPDFLTRIRKYIESYKNETWYHICIPLYDTLSERKIMSLKVMRHDVLASNPYKDVRVPDIEHYRRLEAMGYKNINLYNQVEPIGDHVVRGPQRCYFRYKDTYLAYRLYWGDEHARKKSYIDYKFFIEKHGKTDNSDFLYCLAGMTDGLTRSEDMHKSKDMNEQMVISPEDCLKIYRKRFLRNVII